MADLLKKRKKKVYSEKELDIPKLNMITPVGVEKPKGKKYDYQRPQQGFIYEADNTALDLAAGKKESSIMPWSETIRVLEIMDEVRRQGGTKYPVD